MNVKDEQDFNVNQLIKHRNDLKSKMEKMKDDMENRLIDDKEKLKNLALMGSRVCKVHFQKKTIPSVHYLIIVSIHTQRLQIYLKQGKTIIQLIRLCENIELDHQKMSDMVGRRRKFLNYSEEDLKMPPFEAAAGDDEVRRRETTPIRHLRQSSSSHYRASCTCTRSWKSSGCGSTERESTACVCVRRSHYCRRRTRS
jgi:hypothetical protein